MKVYNLKEANFTEDRAQFVNHYYNSGNCVCLGVVEDTEENRSKASHFAANYAKKEGWDYFTVRVDHVWNGHNKGYYLTVAVQQEKKSFEERLSEATDYGMYDDEVNGWVPVESK